MSEFEEGSKALAATMNAGEKLIDVIDKATSGMLKPRQMIRKAKAAAKVIDIISEAHQKHPEIVFTYKSDEIDISTELAAVSYRAANRLALTEVIKQVNIENVINLSYDELKNENLNTVDEIDKDWILRFFNSIENVSDENMQKLWAKILSGKIKTPRQYSFRTIDILSNLSKEDCEFIEFVSQFTISSNNDLLIYNNDELLAKNGMNFDKLSYLQELNMIHSSLFTSLTINTEKEKSTILTTDKHILLSKKPNTSIDIPVYTFTKSGSEIMKLVKKESNNKFAEEMVKDICKNNKDISCHEIIVRLENGQIQYKTETIYDT